MVPSLVNTDCNLFAPVRLLLRVGQNLADYNHWYDRVVSCQVEHLNIRYLRSSQGALAHIYDSPEWGCRYGSIDDRPRIYPAIQPKQNSTNDTQQDCTNQTSCRCPETRLAGLI